MNVVIQSLTYLRIILAPIIFILILYFEYYGWSLLLFLISSLSDFLDGFLARRYNLESQLGSILDPIADKILLVFLLFSISLSLNSLWIAFLSCILIARELWVSMLRIHNSKIKNDKATSVSFLAKTKTFVQFVAIIGFLIAFYLNIPLIIFISNFILLLSVILSIKTALDYTLNSFSN